MYPIYFKAVLKTEDDHLLERGYACISVENKCVDFKNEFVPLLKMGTTVKIVQVAGEDEIHAFVGQVYLSSPKLLRIVAVSDQELTEAEKQLEVNASIPAQLRPIRSGIALHLPERYANWIDCEIHSVSMETVKFSCPITAASFSTGQKLLLQADQPVHLRKLLAQVYQVMLFGEDVVGYLCLILSVPEPYRTNLAHYVEQQHASARVFPGEISPPPKKALPVRTAGTGKKKREKP